MKLVIGKWAMIFLMSFLMAGCSSIRARTETSNKEWTVYPGIRQNVKDMGGLFSGKNSDPVWLKGVMATIYTVDLPFSAVFDTIVVPYDLYRMHTPKDSGQARESAKQPSTQ